MKPCPFCGSREVAHGIPFFGEDCGQWVVCNPCGARGPVAGTRADAERAWDKALRDLRPTKGGW